MFSGGYIVYMIIGGVFAVVGGIISRKLKSVFKKYGKVPISIGKSGGEIAEQMLHHYGIHDVKVQQGQGFLTDHYNPQTKVINLSPDVFRGRSISAAAVAAHECGHAVQHAEAYQWLKMRSAIVPVVSFASRAQQFLLLIALGGFGASMQAGSTILLITIIAFAITAAFSLVTLPVEFDASKRALAWLNTENILQPQEHQGAEKALWWAAMTYVVQALSSLAILFWLILRFVGSSD